MVRRVSTLLLHFAQVITVFAKHILAWCVDFNE